ncbi:Cytochrome c oxidase subunit 7C, mitochondrial [Halocaridina rubra]|uniref:Cytochrome c oxidase subunit 7C, mitochondrial n=1 Tax=Halocaridina rubra TaxID=373956 RepID=A0AAN9AHG0_HALRR
MLSRAIANRFAVASRNFMTSAIRKGDDPGGVPGSNLPFQIKNRFRLTVTFILFFGSGLALPFVLVRHQLLKQ